MFRRQILSYLIVLVVFPVAAPAQDEQDKKPVRPSDYGRFERFDSGIRLSNDGVWAAVAVRRVDGRRSVRLLATDASSKRLYPNASAPVFSSDSRWLAFRTGPAGPPSNGSSSRRSSGPRSGPPPATKLGLVRLGERKPITIEGIASFRFSEDGKYLAAHRSKPSERKVDSSDLLVRHLDSGLVTVFGNVAGFSWSPEGSMLAMTIEAEGRIGNSVQLYDAAKGLLRTLDSFGKSYNTVTWRRDSFDLAVLCEVVGDDSEGEDDEGSTRASKKGTARNPHIILAWRDVRENKDPFVFDPEDFDDFPEALHVSRDGGLRWSDDGRVVFLGLQGQRARASVESSSAPDNRRRLGDASQEFSTTNDDGLDDEPERSRSSRPRREEPAGVDVWHAKDIQINPLQKKVAERVKKRSILAAWRIDQEAWTRISRTTEESTRVLEGQKHVVVLDPRPHAREQMFGPTLRDVHVVEVATGKRRKILERLKYDLGGSPDGRHFLYLQRGQFGIYDIEKDTHTAVAKNVDADFINDERNTLTDEHSPYGVAGWANDSKHVYLYDRYDLWKVAVDGSAAERLTKGKEPKVRHRRVALDPRPEGDRYIDDSKPMYLALFGERSKKSGFARIEPDARVKQLAWADKYTGALTKARGADVFAYYEEGFDDPTDLFTTDLAFEKRIQLSNLNRFLGDHAWGRSELVDFRSRRGDDLQGALYYPAGYVAGRKYPMIVLIYEERSSRLHRFSTPSETDAYNTAVFTNEGYFVFQPDIVYRPQNPGLSAVDCVVPAVEAVLTTGKVDAKRVGLVGHSWGAYQTAFIVTQTDVFSAGIAGAPLTNMMSMSTSVYWNSGQTNLWIFHESQGRMDRPFWRDIDTYARNSPVFQIDRLDTPLLVAFGDEDGAVDWNQGVELYNAARLAGKPLVMLVYAGENHGLAKRPNKLDYHRRILDWFGHYLKGDDAKRWITDGVPHLEREQERRRLSDDE